MTPADQAGESAVTAVFGVGMFLAFLLLASQALVVLYASSVASAAAFDGARLAAGRSYFDESLAVGVAPAPVVDHVDQLLGGLDDRDREAGRDPLVWSVEAAGPGVDATREVVLTVRLSNPNVVTSGFGFGDIVRTARVAVEE